MRRFTGHQEKWGDFLDVKRYKGKINVKHLTDKKIIFSSSTDAYNPFERDYGVTRDLLKQFIGSEIEVEILTKSDLVIRDLDIFKQIPRIRVGISLNTLDDSVREKLEPHAPSINKRINAIKLLNDEGIDTYIFLSPIFPGITDFKAILNECKEYARMFYFENLNLRGTYRPRVFEYIREYRPDLIALYEEIYKFKCIDYWKMTENEIDRFCRKNEIQYGSWFYHEKIRKR
jgi:DNA repair photolyase